MGKGTLMDLSFVVTNEVHQPCPTPPQATQVLPVMVTAYMLSL